MNKNRCIEKIIRMFSPYCGTEFLGHDGKDVICGPNDRAMIGYDTNFPKQWLIEDFDFAPDEADWFISEVNRLDVGD